MTSYPKQQGRSPIAVVVAAIFVVTLAVNLQLPLYKTYAAIGGYQQGLISVTFAAYVAGLIPVLLLLGGFADRFGNESALSFGLAFALVGHVVIIVDPTIQALILTRVLQGISIGLSLSAGTACLAERSTSPAQAARLSSAAVTFGLGSGGLLTSACLAYRHGLVPLSYYAVALATLVCLCAVVGMVRRRPLSRCSMLRVPLISRQTLPFAVAIFSSWSLTGIILGTIPGQLAISGQAKWSGAIVFCAIAFGSLIQLAPGVRHPFRFVRIGYILVACALLLLIVAIHQGAMLLLFLACALSGLSSFGFTYVGGLTGTLVACPTERARAVSGYYLAGYLGFGFPGIAVGYAMQSWGLERALICYALVTGATFGIWHLVKNVLKRRAAIQCSGTTGRSGIRAGLSRF